MIKAVFFDIGGTIHTQRATPECDRAYAEELWSCLRDHGIQTEQSPALLLPHIDAGAKAYKHFCEEKLIELPQDRIWQEFMLKDYDIPPDQLCGLGEQLCYMFDRRRKHIEQRPGLQEMLEGLRRRGLRMGVISNIMSLTFVPRILEEYGIGQYFETLVLSSVCGIRKPRAEIFEIALKETGLDRHEVCYVGDTISRDVRGVRNARWPLMIQIDNPLTYHKDKKYRGMGFEPDVRIRELSELIPAIEGFNHELEEGA